MNEHRRALRFDFRRYFALSLDALGTSALPYGEARDLVTELSRESASHLHANLVGLDIASSQAELAVILHAEWYMNVHRDKAKQPKAIELPRPWLPKKPNADVDARERARLARDLERRSAFGKK